MTSSTRTEIVRVAADLTSLARVRGLLDETLGRCDWPEEDASRLMLATGEAVCNAIEHGSAAGGEIEVVIDCEGDGLTLVVTDSGDPSRPRPDVDASAAAPPAHAVRGRGLMIMRTLADELRIAQHADGTRVTMRFVRNDGQAENRAHRAA